MEQEEEPRVWKDIMGVEVNLGDKVIVGGNTWVNDRSANDLNIKYVVSIKNDVIRVSYKRPFKEGANLHNNSPIHSSNTQLLIIEKHGRIK